MVQKIDYFFKPEELTGQALIQLELFLYAQKNINVNIRIAALFNLHLAFELTLKEVLVFLLKSFNSKNKLIKLGHNLLILTKKINKYNENKALIINKIIEDHMFLKKESNELRYLQGGDEIFLPKSIKNIEEFIKKSHKEIINNKHLS